MEFTDRYYPLFWINLSLAYIVEYSYFIRSQPFASTHIFHYCFYIIPYSYLEEYFILQANYMWTFYKFGLHKEFIFTTFISWMLTHTRPYWYFMREDSIYYLYVYFYGTEPKFSQDTKFILSLLSFVTYGQQPSKISRSICMDMDLHKYILIIC
jgi:hypothetical protein